MGTPVDVITLSSLDLSLLGGTGTTRTSTVETGGLQPLGLSNAQPLHVKNPITLTQPRFATLGLRYGVLTITALVC